MKNHLGINSQFIPYNLALKLKELGFDEECLSYYTVYGNFSGDVSNARKYNSEFEKSGSYISAPLWEQAFDWFREKYAYFTSFDYQHNENNGFFYCIINIEDEEFYFPEDFEPNIYKTYEEARLACLEKLIELCKSK